MPFPQKKCSNTEHPPPTSLPSLPGLWCRVAMWAPSHCGSTGTEPPALQHRHFTARPSHNRAQLQTKVPTRCCPKEVCHFSSHNYRQQAGSCFIFHLPRLGLLKKKRCTKGFRFSCQNTAAQRSGLSERRKGALFNHRR